MAFGRQAIPSPALAMPPSAAKLLQLRMLRGCTPLRSSHLLMTCPTAESADWDSNVNWPSSDTESRRRFRLNVGLQNQPLRTLASGNLNMSVQYEEVYLKAYESVAHARKSIDHYLTWYNQQRPHSSLSDKTPDEAYFAMLPAIKSAA